MGEIFFGDTGPIRFHPPVPPASSERRVEHLELQPISLTEWRVRDVRLGEDDPRKLVGFIEQNEAGFGAMLLDDGHPSSWVSYPVLEEALLHFETVDSAPLSATMATAATPVTPDEGHELASMTAAATQRDASTGNSRSGHHPRHSAKK
ncbi:hypothetical protein [Parafrigoribacterium soli]|uniref:hypothetical protein n=1 Tax=Parafrigoribacterium soli TaxID=3144663 RepID=UPI0032ED9F21